MPPKEDGTPKAFTWITGNPRSKKNITQIRRHAGQSSAVRAETKTKAPAHDGSPVREQGTSLKPFRATYQFVESKEAAHSWGTFSAGPSLPIRIAESAAVRDSPVRLSDQAHQHVAEDHPVLSLAPSKQIEEKPPPEVVNPVRKVTIWDLVNHSDQEEDGHTEATSSQPSKPDTKEEGPGDVGLERQALMNALSNSRGRSTRDQRGHLSLETTATFKANISKRRRPVGTSPNVAWRIGMAPSAGIVLSREDSQIAELLSQTGAFYTGKFETSWSQRLRENQATFDIMSEMENFSGSVSTAAGLIAVGRIDTASTILGRVLPTLHHLLVTQHPQLYYVLADMSLDTSDTELGRLRGQVKQFSAGVSQTVLGPSHPITRLLRLNLPDEHKRRLRELIQRKVHELHEQLFSATAYQTTGQHYYLARVLSQLGQTDEAARILSSLVTTWDAKYGLNSLMSVTGLLELTKVHLVQSQDHAYAEQLISVALQRTECIEAYGSQQPLSLGVVHSRMGCLRTLGRLHVMRNDYSTALQHYTQAVSLGVNELGPSVPAVQLALADLDTASKMKAQADLSESDNTPHETQRSRGDLLTTLTSINNVAVS